MSASAAEPWGKNVLVEFEEGIAWVSMNRPEKKNAISVDLAREMLATMDALETDPRCGVFVLTGSGDAWSAGMDLKDYFRATDDMPLAIAEMRVPGRAAINAEFYAWKDKAITLHESIQFHERVHLP